MLHALPVSAAPDGVFTLTDRTEARARGPDPTTNALALDLDTLVDARAIWTAHDATYTLANRPRFTLLDFNGGSSTQVGALDSMLAAAEWRWPHVRLRASEDASYGALSFESNSVLPQPGTPTAVATPNGQPAPLPSASLVPNKAQPLLFASSTTSVGSILELRRWTLSSRVGYQVAGGADSYAQQSIPFQHGPLAEGIVDYRLGYRDHLATVANGAETYFAMPATPDTEDLLVAIEEQWRHRWARRTDTLLSAGWYGARIRTGIDAPYTFGHDPIAEAAFNTGVVQGGNTEELHLDVRMAPVINQLAGLVDEQIRGTIAASWAHRRVKLTALATAGESLDQSKSTAVRLATAEIDAAYEASQMFTFDGGVRALYQDLGVVPGQPGQATTLSQGVVFFAVTVRAVKARF